ncbi:hypothetical protein [Priestia aryabhattai]|uniref:hypothetical protein n=1 Tax=Priestia aryabhattai TaxID=412384 RepID=UPI003D2E3ED5
MKFKIFTFHELRYKIFAYSLAFIITIASILAYLNLPKDADTSLASFVLSVVYALVLFVIGLYINNMSSSEKNMFYKKKEQYKGLKRLLEIYEIKPYKENEDELFWFITNLEAFTTKTSPTAKPYLSFDGYSYSQKYLKLKEEYASQIKYVSDLLNKEVNDYIATNKLKKEVRYLTVNIFDRIAIFNDTNSWISEHLDLSEEEINEFTRFLNNLPREQKNTFRKMEKISNRLKKEKDKGHKKCKKNIRRIEEMYGDMLFESLEEENVLVSNFITIQRLIEELKEELLTESYFESNMDSFSDKLEMISDRIDSRLNNVTEEVEDIYFLLLNDKVEEK